MKLALDLARPILDAEEELKGPVADNRLYDAVLAATGDEETASAALSHRIQQRQRANEPVNL